MENKIVIGFKNGEMTCVYSDANIKDVLQKLNKGSRFMRLGVMMFDKGEVVFMKGQKKSNFDNNVEITLKDGMNICLFDERFLIETLRDLNECEDCEFVNIGNGIFRKDNIMKIRKIGEY